MTTPALPDGRQWAAETMDWWGAVWASPMAAQYVEVDRHALIRLAVTVNDYWEAGGDYKLRASLAAEIRQASKSFGLAPLDRRIGGFPVIAEPPCCAWCEQPFAPSRKDQRYCRPSHRVAASRERRRRR